MTRAGIVAVVGKPNAGKSTLLNRLVGQKLSITSPKPQSTRVRVVGIDTTEEVQMVILDTPGLLNPRYALQHAMRASSLQALADADVIVYVTDVRDGPPPTLTNAALLDRPPSAPVVTALNKIDTIAAPRRESLREQLPDSAQISALTGEGIPELRDILRNRLPESPFLYPADEIGAQPLRFFVAELIRETALEQLEDEVPYSIACEVEEFRETRQPVYIRAVVFVERDSQKRILIGHHGSRIRSIGQSARYKVEALVGAPVYLDLWVKVLENWRRDAGALRRFGFTIPSEKRT